MIMETLIAVAIAVAVVAAAVFILAVASSRFRIVVPTNDVHIVQHADKTSTYGKDQTGGNVYYHWPSWIPQIGVMVTKLPSSVFALKLDNYPAYDKGRVPFVLDVIGFFRITDFSSASSRVSDLKDLQAQLDGILKGAMRSILASSEIEEILQGRSQFGEKFTNEVDMQLTQWGTSSVKAIELMDIRDAEGSKVIANIMAKKKSLIERQSRIEVAENMRAAEVAEIDAKQAVEVRAQEQAEVVGKRTAERTQNVGIRQQQADQKIQEEQAKTAEKTMDVRRVNQVREAEIQREAQVVAADQAKQVMVIEAEASRSRQVIEGEAKKKVTVVVAEGVLESEKMKATAREVNGAAEGKAQTAILMAPVDSQIALAKEIGANVGYQSYLVSIKQIDASRDVGIEAARALEHAAVKIVATTGSPMDGVKSVMDLMTPKGATQLGAALEAFSNTDAGQRLTAFLNKGNGVDTTPGG